MGFLARTVFWLGLVYASIPLDLGSLFVDRPARLADVNPLAVCAAGPSEACLRRAADLRKALDEVQSLGIVDRLVSAVEADAPVSRPAPHKPQTQPE